MNILFKSTIIPHSSEMLANNMQEFDNQNMCSFLQELDNKEEECLEHEQQDFDLDKYRERNWGSFLGIMGGGVGGTVGFTTKLLVGSSLVSGFAIGVIAAVGVGLCANMAYHNIKTCMESGSLLGSERRFRLIKKIEAIDQELGNVKDKAIARQMKIARDNFAKISENYEKAYKKASSVIVIDFPGNSDLPKRHFEYHFDKDGIKSCIRTKEKGGIVHEKIYDRDAKNHDY